MSIIMSKLFNLSNLRNSVLAVVPKINRMLDNNTTQRSISFRFTIGSHCPKSKKSKKSKSKKSKKRSKSKDCNKFKAKVTEEPKKKKSKPKKRICKPGMRDPCLGEESCQCDEKVRNFESRLNQCKPKPKPGCPKGDWQKGDPITSEKAVLTQVKK